MPALPGVLKDNDHAMSDNSKTPIFEMMAEMGHEQVIFCHDAPSGYRGVIAIHSTALGPAVGGTRFWNYASEEEAMIDALRLSRGMTYKCAAAGVPLGGGKAIIIADNKTRDREKLFRAHGRFVERLAGRYITAEDVGTSPADMELIALETSYVGGLAGKGGDPSPWTGLGAFRAMQAAARYRWAAMIFEADESRFKVAATSVITLRRNCTRRELDLSFRTSMLQRSSVQLKSSTQRRCHRTISTPSRRTYSLRARLAES